MRTPPNESLSSDIVEAPKARKASEPERRCVISGQTGPREELVRLAVSPALSCPMRRKRRRVAGPGSVKTAPVWKRRWPMAN